MGIIFINHQTFNPTKITKCPIQIHCVLTLVVVVVVVGNNRLTDNVHVHVNIHTSIPRLER